MNDQNLQHLIESISQSARKASLELTTLTSEKKNQFLYDLADALEANIEGILEANAVDIDNAKSMDLSPPMIERLQFTKDRINQMAVGVRQVAELSNPVGETIEQMNPPRGFDLRKIRVPIGVIGIIYESRPNVTRHENRKPKTDRPQQT
jgi:glutamate-5-semialdehyde dehydrogenase